MLSKNRRRGSTFVTAGTTPFRPSSTHSKNVEPENCPTRGSLCWWLRTNDQARTRTAADAGPLLRGIQALRPDNQTRKDECSPLTWTILTPPPPNITLDDKPLANVEHFKYLGSTISCDGSLDREIDTRISKASIRNCVLNEHNIHLFKKMKVYNAVILPSLLYGCVTWTLYRWHIKKTGALPHASSVLHPRNQVVGPHHQSEGPRSS